VGTKFRFIAEPKPGWSGVVDCEVLEVDEPSLLRYSWVGDQGGDVTEVVYRVQPHADGVEPPLQEHLRRGVGQLLAHQPLLALPQPFGVRRRGPRGVRHRFCHGPGAHAVQHNPVPVFFLLL
jgi:hypothetical protein